jgi:hypothetical protein
MSDKCCAVSALDGTTRRLTRTIVVLGGTLPFDVIGEFSGRMKGDYTPLRDRYLLSALQIARPPLWPFLRLEAAESFELYGFSGFKSGAHFLKYRVDHFATFALAQTDSLEEEILQFFLRQRRAQNAFRLAERHRIVIGAVSIDALECSGAGRVARFHCWAGRAKGATRTFSAASGMPPRAVLTERNQRFLAGAVALIAFPRKR